jgi:predicted dehydrogenase
MATHPGHRPHIGLVGCGRWGRNILRDLVVLGCEVSVVARSAESREAAESGGAARILGDVCELPTIDGVVVAAPTPQRPAILRALLARDIPLFTEKPLATSVSEAEDLATLSRGRLFVMEKWRYHPGIRALAAIARSGRFGPVTGVRTTRLGWGIDHPDVDAVWTLLPHDISVVDEILGAIPEPLWAIGESPNGEPAALVGRLGESPWAVVDVSAASRRHQREVRLCCADGTVVLDDAQTDHLEVVCAQQPGAPPSTLSLHLDCDEMPLLAELREFVGHVGGGPEPRVSAGRSVAVVRAIVRLRHLAGFGES